MILALVGSTGQVGQALLRCCRSDWEVHALTRRDLDMARPASIDSTIRRLKPDVIVNASGYTAVDRAEQEPDLARLINADAVDCLAKAARSIGACLVHYSTDYVFDGTATEPHSPDDLPNPQSAYARSKREGEIAVVESGASHLILRTQWVYGLTGRNFMLAILKQAQRASELRIVNDQVGAPTWSVAIARATAEIIASGIAGREGVYHLACAGATTWHDFAQAVFDEARILLPELPQPRLIPVSTSEYGAPAARPAYSVLDCLKTERAFGVRLPHWRETLHEALSEVPALKHAIAIDETSNAGS